MQWPFIFRNPFKRRQQARYVFVPIQSEQPELPGVDPLEVGQVAIDLAIKFPIVIGVREFNKLPIELQHYFKRRAK